MLDHVLHGYLNAMECEHNYIARLLRSLEHDLDAIGVHGHNAKVVQSVIEQLEELDHCLVEHFKREEAGGFLDDAASTAPRFAHEANALLEEHNTLLEHIKDLLKMAHAEVDGRNNWPSFAAASRNLIRQLKSHEERENELLRRSFNATS